MNAIFRDSEGGIHVWFSWTVQLISYCFVRHKNVLQLPCSGHILVTKLPCLRAITNGNYWLFGQNISRVASICSKIYSRWQKWWLCFAVFVQCSVSSIPLDSSPSEHAANIYCSLGTSNTGLVKCCGMFLCKKIYGEQLMMINYSSR